MKIKYFFLFGLVEIEMTCVNICYSAILLKISKRSILRTFSSIIIKQIAGSLIKDFNLFAWTSSSCYKIIVYRRNPSDLMDLIMLYYFFYRDRFKYFYTIIITFTLWSWIRKLKSTKKEKNRFLAKWFSSINQTHWNRKLKCITVFS